MKKRVLIIHGWEGTPDSNWFPWLKAEFEKKGFEVAVPQMPNADFPVAKEWLEHLQKIVGEPDENTFLVGHSLGVIAILRYLEALKTGKKVGGAVLVAGFPEHIGIGEIENFFAVPLDYEKVKSAAKKIVAINSDNDPYVPIRQGRIMRDKLGAEFKIIPNGDHLSEGDGSYKFPLVLEEILKMAS
jgi:uncharacterized protein